MSLDDETNGDVVTSASGLLLPAERSDLAPIITDGVGMGQDTTKDSSGAITITRKYVPVLTTRSPVCGAGKGRIALLGLGGLLVGTSLALMVAGTIRFHQCQEPEVGTFFQFPCLWEHINNK